MITSIKTLQSLSAIVYFRVRCTQEEIATQVRFELLARVQQCYQEDVYKCKFLVAIVRDLTGTQCKQHQADQLLVAVELLHAIMQRHLDTAGLQELALTALKAANAAKDSAVTRKLCSTPALDLLMEVLDRHAAEPKVSSLCLALANLLKANSAAVQVRIIQTYLQNNDKYQAHANKEDIS